MQDEKDHVRDVAIVLRQRSNLLSVLSIGHGRTEKLFYDHKRYATGLVGSIVSYHVYEARYDYSRVDRLEIERHPSLYHAQSIYLLHALIEVCYHYIPLGTQANDACRYVVDILANLNAFTSGIEQKKIVCLLFALLGLYPDKEFLDDEHHAFLYAPVDKLKDLFLELPNEELVHKWLVWCLTAYPQGKWCKALPLLVKSTNL